MIKNKELKRRIVEISYKLKLGHLGSCLTAVDIIDEIYKIKKPDEKFVLSAGHAHLAHAVVKDKEMMALKGPSYDLGWVETTIKQNGIHCQRYFKGGGIGSGCDVSTGSLGHGIGIAVGMALADRTKNIYCLLSDGEIAEGSVYEAFNIIREQKLDNLKVYLNDNGFGAYKRTHLGAIPRFVNVRFTHMNDYPKWLQGQVAHYKVLNKKEFKELMEVLK